MPGEKNFFQTFGEAFAKGDIFTKVSFLVWGLGYIGHGQLMKALLVTLVEGLGLYFLAFYGAPNLAKFGTLGLMRADQIPDIHAIYVEKKELLPFAYGAKGIGEIATIPTAPAVQGAYYARDHVLRTALPMQDTFYRPASKGK